MKVLITGATGYVGRHLAHELKGTGHEIFAIVRKGSATESLLENNIGPIIGDIRNKGSINEIVPYFDIIIHLAFSLFPGADAETNITGFDHIVSFAQRNPLQRFIFVSSQLVYGPTPENEIIDEDASCHTNMLFGKHQLRAENKLMRLFHEENFPAVILRPSEIFGGEGGFFKKVQLDGYINGKVPIIGNGKNAISFTYIGDLTQVIVQCMHRDGIEGNSFNINTPGVLRLNELIRLVKHHTKMKTVFKVPAFIAWAIAFFAVISAKLRRTVPWMDYDVVRVATMQSGERSTAKAQKMLGFCPKYLDPSSALIDCYFSDIQT